MVAKNSRTRGAETVLFNGTETCKLPKINISASNPAKYAWSPEENRQNWWFDLSFVKSFYFWVFKNLPYLGKVSDRNLLCVFERTSIATLAVLNVLL